MKCGVATCSKVVNCQENALPCHIPKAFLLGAEEQTCKSPWPEVLQHSKPNQTVELRTITLGKEIKLMGKTIVMWYWYNFRDYVSGLVPSPRPWLPPASWMDYPRHEISSLPDTSIATVAAKCWMADILKPHHESCANTQHQAGKPPIQLSWTGFSTLSLS